MKRSRKRSVAFSPSLLSGGKEFNCLQKFLTLNRHFDLSVFDTILFELAYKSLLAHSKKKFTSFSKTSKDNFSSFLFIFSFA